MVRATRDERGVGPVLVSCVECFVRGLGFCWRWKTSYVWKSGGKGGEAVSKDKKKKVKRRGPLLGCLGSFSFRVRVRARIRVRKKEEEEEENDDEEEEDEEEEEEEGKEEEHNEENAEKEMEQHDMKNLSKGTG